MNLKGCSNFNLVIFSVWTYCMNCKKPFSIFKPMPNHGSLFILTLVTSQHGVVFYVQNYMASWIFIIFKKNFICLKNKRNRLCCLLNLNARTCVFKKHNNNVYLKKVATYCCSYGIRNLFCVCYDICIIPSTDGKAVPMWCQMIERRYKMIFMTTVENMCETFYYSTSKHC